ncbi:MAG: glycosyltransferase, partial [Geminicoccaceae bacterium]
IAADVLANLTAIEARRRADRSLPVILTQRTHTSTFIAGKFNKLNRKKLLAGIERLYPEAEAIIGVSEGVSADLIDMGLPRHLVRTIYNPVIGPDTVRLAAEAIDHPWFRTGQPPVILGVGRLTPQKDYPTLVRAFARLIDRGRDLRLVIVGSEKSEADRKELLTLASSLGVQDRLDLPGSVANPFGFMARSALVACSSRWEGLPAMLIEALAVGTPAVSTDCPSGPREVLDGGALGRLVPMGDDEALAEAMAATLDDPPDPERLKQSTARFTVQASVDAYSALIDEVCLKRAA